MLRKWSERCSRKRRARVKMYSAWWMIHWMDCSLHRTFVSNWISLKMYSPNTRISASRLFFTMPHCLTRKSLPANDRKIHVWKLRVARQSIFHFSCFFPPTNANESQHKNMTIIVLQLSSVFFSFFDRHRQWNWCGIKIIAIAKRWRFAYKYNIMYFECSSEFDSSTNVCGRKQLSMLSFSCSIRAQRCFQQLSNQLRNK